nr:MAG TPA: hypothetical protein [Caudoviricetes sp.]
MFIRKSILKHDFNVIVVIKCECFHSTGCIFVLMDCFNPCSILFHISYRMSR